MSKYREYKTSGTLDCPRELGLLQALVPMLLQPEQLHHPSCMKRGLAAKAHLAFLCAPLKSLGVEVDDKAAVSAIKIQP